MNISLTPELEQLVTDKVESGLYLTASEVIREGLRLLEERDKCQELFRNEIGAGFEAVDRGEYVDFDESSIQELAARVKARGRDRLLAEGRATGR